MARTGLRRPENRPTPSWRPARHSTLCYAEVTGAFRCRALRLVSPRAWRQGLWVATSQEQEAEILQPTFGTVVTFWASRRRSAHPTTLLEGLRSLSAVGCRGAPLAETRMQKLGRMPHSPATSPVDRLELSFHRWRLEAARAPAYACGRLRGRGISRESPRPLPVACTAAAAWEASHWYRIGPRYTGVQEAALALRRLAPAACARPEEVRSAAVEAAARPLLEAAAAQGSVTPSAAHLVEMDSLQAEALEVAEEAAAAIFALLPRRPLLPPWRTLRGCKPGICSRRRGWAA